jgi:hypothetical protein
MGRTARTIATIVVLFVASGALAADKKLAIHFCTVPIIEGTGIYASVASLADAHASLHTDIAAGTNLGLLATQGTLGLLTAFSSGERRTKVRSIHHVVAFLVASAGIWLGVANSIDHAHDHSNVPQQVAAYVYGGLATGPIIMFSF